MALPDLVVTEIVVIPALPSAGEGVLRATIENVGDEQAGGLVALIDWTAYRDSVQCDVGVIIGSMDPGEIVDVQTTACAPTATGTYLVRFEVDTQSEVDESNENNNERAELMTWYLFADGFEGGDTSRWSMSSP